ncbi:DUF2235 domain-containing protein [Lutimaribacter sp. EGI FJ00015]|uniref:DUF2235 domain-containing protein n=1 Tax=Lutimaribacter degradans TaxID=2945989 RepID=A0ACC5ZRC9_9RHOB|nr:DUF2235 domain-containing protein [Lutimaribacter sp. EGI FJ00013]MCM2560700.1 DUF2235 domain-containing protein [Lutimaribacter sp. EGI FJ00013]MCO0612356.1 DUF2235 domain-containing protein [Lutimaribacter sp. EGI FJ00015]MCO0634524.1 DUF2235 domain-containing protein [Lutimaribacter sp. EGI FJ00014]
MPWRQLHRRIFNWVWPGQEVRRSAPMRRNGGLIHVIILDGTMSSLEPGCESNAGLTCRLLGAIGAPVNVYYEPGLQWCDWRSTTDVMLGRGINRQIRRAYGYLASRYRPGDRIFLMGYSRGAYAVRSLAGVIDSVGLLRAECATERNVQIAYRHYQSAPGSEVARVFRDTHCHARVEIEMVGIWDTVKALGLRLPFLWQWSPERNAFHSHALGPSVQHGFHALALDETRSVYTPVLWETSGSDAAPHIEQVWFRGTHGDVGGHLGGFEPARPLANVSLVWMLERAEICGLPLPDGWRARFPCDPAAPSIGTWRGVGKLFLLRRKRVVGADRSERLHETVAHATPGLAAPSGDPVQP